MRRVICLFVIVLICFVGIDIIRTVHKNNSIYDQIKQKELYEERQIDAKNTIITNTVDQNESKVEEYERYEKWNQEILENMR